MYLQNADLGISYASGKPVANVTYRLTHVTNEGRNADCGIIKADSNGAFHKAGLLPGRYYLYGMPGAGQDYYSDPVPLDIYGADVEGLTITLQPSMTIIGTLSAVDSKKAKLPISPASVPLLASSAPAGGGCLNPDKVTLASDGSFTISGVVPGVLAIDLDHNAAPKGLSLLRLEPSDKARGLFLTISPGDQAVSVKAIISYSTGKIRGEIITDGWQLPQNMRINIAAAPRSKDAAYAFSVANEKGVFLLDHVADGDYEITLNCTGIGSAICSTVRQRVTVAAGTAPFVTLLLPKPAANN